MSSVFRTELFDRFVVQLQETGDRSPCPFGAFAGSIMQRLADLFREPLARPVAAPLVLVLGRRLAGVF